VAVIAALETTAALEATAWGQIWGQIGDDGGRMWGPCGRRANEATLGELLACFPVPQATKNHSYLIKKKMFH
jgi:hypothetical protein